MSEYVPVELRREIRELFADCCADCRTAERLTVAIFEIEHVIPQAAGGQTVAANLCLACPTCNRYKAGRTSALDPDTQEQVALFSPVRDAWDEHFAWSAGATEIIGLTGSGRATIAALRLNRPQLIRVRRMWVEMGEHPPEVT